MIYYLYVKIHPSTNLKYFGKTISKDPYKYKGSGKYWKDHIRKHGRSLVETVELWEFDNQQACTEFALKFSKENNIVESKEWANLCYEDGLTFGTTGLKHKDSTKKILSTKRKQYLSEIDLLGENNPFYGKHHTSETKNNIRSKLKGKKLSQKHRANISKNQIGRVISEETKEKIRKTMTGRKYSKERVEASIKGRQKQRLDNYK